MVEMSNFKQQETPGKKTTECNVIKQKTRPLPTPSKRKKTGSLQNWKNRY